MVQFATLVPIIALLSASTIASPLMEESALMTRQADSECAFICKAPTICMVPKYKFQQPKKATCGDVGSYTQFGQTTPGVGCLTTTQSDCANACASIGDECIGFLWNSATQQCKTLKEAPKRAPNPDSATHYWDRACFQPPAACSACTIPGVKNSY